MGQPAPSARRAVQVEPARKQVEQPAPSVRRAEQVEPARKASAAAAGAASLAREADIPDSLFDELFNEAEDSYFGTSSSPLKASDLQIVQSAAPSRSDIDNGLDAFLNTTLHVDAQPAPAIQATQATAATD